MEKDIHIYHTNDLHSHFDYWPRIREFLKQRKRMHQEAGEEMIVIDVGDHIDRFHPYTEGTYGEGNIAILNDAGYDYGVIGNNEGITMPHDKLDSLYSKAEFKVLTANLFQLDGNRPSWALPSLIHSCQNGLKIGFIGVTASYPNYYKVLDWEITDPFEAVRAEMARLQGQADSLVLLSHLGIFDDEKMASRFPRLDVILGAHTHHVLPEGKQMDHTLICAAGKYGYYIGHVVLSAAGSRAFVYETPSLPPAEGEKEFSEHLYSLGKRELSIPSAELPFELKTDLYEPSQLPQMLCEGLREWCGADCAFLNAGLILDSLPKGTVTKFDIHRICPHPINPCIADIKGSELKEILEISRDESWPGMQIKGLGFRGTIMGRMLYDSIEFKNEKILIQGALLNPEKMYKLAIPDMFTFGRYFPSLKHLSSKRYLMPEFLRDVLESKLKKISL